MTAGVSKCGILVGFGEVGRLEVSISDFFSKFDIEICVFWCIVSG